MSSPGWPRSPAPLQLLLTLVLAAVSVATDVVGPAMAADEGALDGNAALEADTQSSASDAATAADAAAPAVLGAMTCVGDFGQVHTAPDSALEGVALTPNGAWGVGFERLRYATRRPVVMRNAGGLWKDVPASSPGGEDGLVAVVARDDEHAWAVGFTTPAETANPLAMRWDGQAWRVDQPASQGVLTNLLTDVALGRDGRPWAVGYRMTADGKRRPVFVRRDDRGWRYGDAHVGQRESIALTGIAPDGRGGFWAVGHGGLGSLVSPVVYRHDGRRWRRLTVPRVRQEGVLTDVVATAPADAWAVGYQLKDGRTSPLILRWDGRSWERGVAPRFGSQHTVLTAASAAPSGGIWVVGARWREDLASHEAVAAWWDGQAWNEVSGVEGGTLLSDVAGAPDAEGWAVGRFGQEARAAKVCGRPQVGILGGSEPADEPGPDDPAQPDPDDPAQPDPAEPDPDERDATPLPAPSDDPAEPVDHEDSDHADEGDADDEQVADDLEEGPDRDARAPAELVARSRKRRRTVKQLPTPRQSVEIVARNVAQEVGLAESTATYGAVAADFDGDGRADLFIGRHGRPGRLALNRGGTFVDHEAVDFPRVDRHGCTAMDVDGSGLPDLYCTVGASRGSGFKANELWIDPGGPTPVNVAAAAGVLDATGRGRQTTFLRSGRGGAIDLVVTNSPVRVDGLPSLGRLFRSRGDGTFAGRPNTGFAARLGALAIDPGDYDADGRDDLLLVTGGPQAPQADGTRLYRNTRGGLVDVTATLGIRSFGEIDAELVDLNRDGRLDLVRLSETRMRVSLWRRGHFVPVYERALTHGRAVVSGDVDGDRFPDLYVLRGNSRGNPADVMLLNRGRGYTFSSMIIPQVYAGDGDDAVAIDHDGNGLTDFLVLNGRSVRGPVALIAFYRRGAATRQ